MTQSYTEMPRGYAEFILLFLEKQFSVLRLCNSVFQLLTYPQIIREAQDGGGNDT